MGVRTVNLVRGRPDMDSSIEYLKSLGGDVVVADKYIQDFGIKKTIGDLPAAKLALNCTGGRSALDMCRMLDNGGHFVTYGGMSRQSIDLGAAPFIFKDIKA